MTGPPILQEVKRFVEERVDSVAELEALLLLRGDPAAEWSVAILAQRLYTSPEFAERALGHLVAGGLISAGPGEKGPYRYAPADELRGTIDRLAEVYRRELIAITQIVHDKTGAVRQFAEAFRLGRRDGAR